MPESVVITRAGHPFTGQRLQVLSRQLRVGQPHLLLLLPDQSRGLIPADWTDLASNNTPATDALGSLDDLLRARLIIDALLRQTEQESNDATEPGLPGSVPGRRRSVATTRRSNARSGDQQARSGNRKGRSGQQPSELAGDQ
ncbi:hypothetical protein IHE29_15725 [Mycetohabitans rhizoxinica]|uniref:Uncharacterized protein n=1 Tax=Mycetohabitans rhizoxinica TaxID=412963 RepID=A0ABZ2PSH3_9BURK